MSQTSDAHAVTAHEKEPHLMANRLPENTLKINLVRLQHSVSFINPIYINDEGL